MSRPGLTPGITPSVASPVDGKRKFTASDRPETNIAVDRSPPPDRRDIGLVQNGTHKRQRLSNFERDTGLEDTHRIATEHGDFMSGAVGSASSASTTSSVFSHHGHSTMSSSNGASSYSMHQTPPTVHDSSPTERSRSPKPSARPQSRSHEHDPVQLSTHTPGQSSVARVPNGAITPRPRARPGPGEIKGQKIAYDPEMDPKHKKTPKEQRISARWRPFGQNELPIPPPDPRLAIPGYRDGNLGEFRSQARSAKQKLRDRLLTLSSYAWDPLISVGAGPPTAIVVTGFDPLVSGDTQLRFTFGSFGEIAALENRTDPNTGGALGICWIRYRDSHRDGRMAADAAKQAERDGSKLRIGTRTVVVERDRTGKKASRYVERAARKAEERRLKELEAEQARRMTRVLPSRATAVAAHGDSSPAPPPNAPKGPSGKSSMRPPEAPRAAAAKAAAQDLIEQESVLSNIKRKPYVFIPDSSVPVMGTTIPHLKKRMKVYDWREVRCDQKGYYLVFEDSKRGEDEAVRCHKEMNGKPMFTYTLDMDCQQYGNPDYERSPSPERAALIKRENEERERREQDAKEDWEAERKVRAENLDPAVGSLEQLCGELMNWVINDLKSKIAAPVFHDFLEPGRHAAKREELGISAPPERPQNQPLFIAGDVAGQARSGARYGDSRRQTIAGRSGKTGGNAFVDERRQKANKRRPTIMSLHHKLLAGMQEEDSDDEEKASSRDEAKDLDSRSISRFSSVAPDAEATVRSRLRTVEGEDSMQGEDSGEDDMAFARKFLDPNLLRKEPEDMAIAELQQVVSTLPRKSNLHKHAQKELRIRRRNRDDDRLFSGIKTEDVAQSVETSVEDIGLMTPEEDAIPAKKKKETKGKKKSKKQLFQEREAAKAAAQSAKALLKETSAPLAEVQVPEDEHARDEYEEEDEEEEERAEVEWGVSTDVPRRTVEDEPGLVMDIDGWQHIVKDDEDFRFLQEALKTVTPAKLGSPHTWAHNQKEIKRLNVDSDDPQSDSAVIRGYYLPNESGSARTEGVSKILESEKSKYLPHRLKVAAARARRQAEKANPATTANVEAAKKAKLASTAMSRSNRATNRTHMKDINTVKQNLILDGQQGDAVRFNALKKRKKLVKFERSAIHGWGLYADENIALGDMIIEYVGEKVRQAVANIREIRYDKQGMGSSYLFRIDDDSVVDATKKGGIARFINHSCAPNCTAKIIKVEGTKRIVIYALKEIAKDEELTYDYKFDRELDNNDRIPCLCGSEVCKGFLN